VRNIPWKPAQSISSTDSPKASEIRLALKRECVQKFFLPHSELITDPSVVGTDRGKQCRHFQANVVERLSQRLDAGRDARHEGASFRQWQRLQFLFDTRHPEGDMIQLIAERHPQRFARTGIGQRHYFLDGLAAERLDAQIQFSQKLQPGQRTEMGADRGLLLIRDQWGIVDAELFHPSKLNGHMPALVADLFGERQFGGGIGRMLDPLGTDFHNELIDLGIEHQ
jgi:hypothetical protein